LVLLLFLVLLLWAAAQLPGVQLPFVQHAKTGPIPGMNSSQCAEAGGKFDLIYGCVSK